MKKIISFTIILLLFPGIICAQEGTAVYNRLKQQYDHVHYFKSRGDYCYEIVQNGLRGCCDKDGRVVVKPKYTYVHYSRSENVFEVKIGDRVGLLDVNGKEIVAPSKYTSVHYNSSENVFEVEIGDKAGLLDMNGKEIVSPSKYTYVYYNKYEKMYKVKVGDKAGLLDENGNVLVEADKYTDVDWVSYGKQYKVKIGDLTGVLDSTGKELFAPSIYPDVEYDYKQHLFYVKKDGKIGILDSLGEVLVDLVEGFSIRYDKKYKCYYTWVENPKSLNLYSPSGKSIFTSTDGEMGFVGEGLVAVKDNNGKWGYIDVTTGKMVIPFQYTSAGLFENGVAKVSKGNESFLISNPLKGNGSEILSSLTLGQAVHSDIDEDIFESKRVQENTFAIIISVQNYFGFVSPFAANDSRTFRLYCEKTLGIPQNNITYLEDATLNNIHSAMTRIQDLADAYEGDASIIFYFAGQGASDNAGNPYLMPSDAALDMISSTGYSVEKLYSELGKLNIQSAIVLLDAGFNNENRDGEKIPNGSNNNIKTKNVPITGNVVSITATSIGESAHVYKEKGHGIFTYFLCKKIKENKGIVDLQTLYEYLKTNSRTFQSEKQTPQISSSNIITPQNIKL